MKRARDRRILEEGLNQHLTPSAQCDTMLSTSQSSGMEITKMTEAVATEVKTVDTREFDGTIENAYGQELETPISFSGSYEHVLEFTAIPPKEMPDKDDILSFVNSKRKANARQKSMQSALDAAGIKKPTLDDPAVQYREMVKILVKSGKSEKESKAIAGAALNYTE